MVISARLTTVLICNAQANLVEILHALYLSFEYENTSQVKLGSNCLGCCVLIILLPVAHIFNELSKN